MYRINKRDTSKLTVLFQQEGKLFHTNDLALLWGITNKNTLYTTITRYLKRGVLFPIQKGFYATSDPVVFEPVKLGIAYLHQYAYLSTETVLAEAGVINQTVPHITLVSSISKKFKLGSYSYFVRQMKERFLQQTTGIVMVDGYQKATVERAVVDLLYFNPCYHFDGTRLLDWKKIKKIQKELGFK
jgi:predicted transcriptional regulator of viral defense system